MSSTVTVTATVTATITATTTSTTVSTTTVTAGGVTSGATPSPATNTGASGVGTSTTQPPSPTSGSSTATSTSSSSNNGVSNGEAAGIAVGCFVAGLLLAGLLYFFLLRGSKRNRQVENHTGHVPPQAGGLGYAGNGYPLAAVGIEKHLPQPVEDNKILSEMSNVRDKIKNHAQSFYHTTSIDPSQLNASAVQGISSTIAIPASSLTNILLNPATRIAGIRACIAGVIFSRFGGHGLAGDSLLPAQMAYSADAFETPGSSDQVKLLSKSKVITGTLFQQRSKSNYQGDEESIGRAVRAINDIVAPFVQNNNDQRLKNLDGIIRRASQFAVLLYSQPSLWRFDWRSSTSGAVAAGSPTPSIVVVPALLQIVSDEAEILEPPRVFTEPEIVANQ